MAQVQQPAPSNNKAQAAAMAMPKILRIGIIQSGKIVEERLVRKHENVTIGQSAKNTFVVPASMALPRSFTLFEVTGTGYALNFAEGMDGRIAFDTNVAPVTLAQLRAKAQKRGDTYHVVMNDRARGKVVIGDVTVLFQFVTPPPIQPRPQLPPSVRGSVTDGLDWIMISIMAISLVGHMGFCIYLRNVDWPRKPDIEDIPDRFVQMIVPQKKEEPKKVENVDPNAKAKAEADAKAARDKARKAAAADKAKGEANKPRDPEAEARAAAERRARMAADIGKTGLLKVIGAKGEGGTIADLIRGGDPGGDADKVFSQVGGVGVAGAGEGGGGLRSKGAGGSGTAKGIGGLRAAGPGDVSSGEKGAEKAVHAKIADVQKVDVDGSLSPDVVVATIRQRKSAIITCYERALKRNPNLAGKVSLHFTISQVGKVTAADIEDDTLGDSEVNSCITSTVKGWRFPAPSGGDVQFSYPFIFTASK